MKLHDNSYISLQLGYCPSDKGYVGFESVDLEYRLVDTVFPNLSSDAVNVYLILRYLQNLEDVGPTPTLPIIHQRFCPMMTDHSFSEAVEELTHLYIDGKPFVTFEEEDRDLKDRLSEIHIEKRGRG